MEINAHKDQGLSDTLKWLAGLLLLAGAVVGNSYFDDYSVLYRAIGVLLLIGLALWTVSTTNKGQLFMQLLKGARIEIKKVVWPTRQETLQTTAGVLFVVFLVAIVLWLLDTFLGWLISVLIG